MVSIELIKYIRNRNKYYDIKYNILFIADDYSNDYIILFLPGYLSYKCRTMSDIKMFEDNMKRINRKVKLNSL